MQNRRTIKEQIAHAKFAYIFEICENRYKVYLQDEHSFVTMPIYQLWPLKTIPEEAESEFIMGMIYSDSKEYPAYHFYLDGYGYNKQYEIKAELIKYNSKLTVFMDM